MKKTTAFIFSIFIIYFFFSYPVNSFYDDDYRLLMAENKIYAKEKLDERNEEISQRVRQKKEGNKEKKENIIDSIKDKIKNLKWPARISGNITGVNGSTIAVSGKDGKSYDVYVNDKTKIKRRFWGKSSLAEFSAGDEVYVVGKWKNEEKTQIDAIMIRNNSIQKRNGVFFGEVESKDDASFVIKTIKRGDDKVLLNEQIKYISVSEKNIAYSDIKVGDKVRVRGVWNRSLNQISEVTEIKDFSIKN